MWCTRWLGRVGRFSWIVSVDDVPVGRWSMVGGEAQQGFERNMAVEASIVAKHEFVEIGVDVLAAEAVICAERPSLEQREGAMAPRQSDVTGHGTDDARIVPIGSQAWIGCVAIRQKGGSRLHVGLDERLDRRGRIVGDSGEAKSTGARIDIFGVLAARVRLIGVAINHLDGSDHQDFSGVARLEKGVAFTQWDFRLIDFNDPFERVSIWINHRSPQLLSQQPGGLVSDAELVLQLARRHTVGVSRHEMRRPEPCGQR